MSVKQSHLWKIKRKVDDFAFEKFVECMADIAVSVNDINERCRQGQLEPHDLNRGCRNISVAIRKLMFDGNGHLFKENVEPLLHPLKDPRKRPKKGRQPDVLMETIGSMSVEYTIGESNEPHASSAPGYKHRTVVSPLYGLLRIGEKQYQLEDPFDWRAQPIKFSRWMNKKILQINDVVLNAERVLYLFANYEGAHIDSNQMTHINTSLPIDLKLPDNKDELYRRGNWVTFGGVSYLHIFTLLFGIYLVNMARETLNHISANQVRRAIWRPILQSPSKIASPTLHLQKDFSIGMVFENTHNGLEVIGDLEDSGTTLVQIPGWR